MLTTLLLYTEAACHILISGISISTLFSNPCLTHHCSIEPYLKHGLAHHSPSYIPSVSSTAMFCGLRGYGIIVLLSVEPPTVIYLSVLGSCQSLYSLSSLQKRGFSDQGWVAFAYGNKHSNSGGNLMLSTWSFHNITSNLQDVVSPTESILAVVFNNTLFVLNERKQWKCKYSWYY